MLTFVKCLNEGLAAVGIRGLLAFVPGGKYLFDAAVYAMKRYREQKTQRKLEDEFKAKIDALLAIVERGCNDALHQLVCRGQELAPSHLATDNQLACAFAGSAPPALCFDVKIIDHNTIYVGVSYHTVIDWILQGRMAVYDAVCTTGESEGWVTISKHPLLASVLVFWCSRWFARYESLSR